MSAHITETYEFAVEVKRYSDGSWATVIHDAAGYRATTSSNDLDATVHMAVPYITTCCELDPFAALAGLKSSATPRHSGGPVADAPGLGESGPGATLRTGGEAGR